MSVTEGLPDLNAGPGPVAKAASLIRTVAVIGAGEQGRVFALRCARAGFQTVLEDVMPARLRQARQELSSLDDPAAASRVSFAMTVEDAVREADLAIDFVPDELESKLEIFSMVDRMAPPRTILCTPTKTLSISDLASCTYRAERCVALHATETGLAADRLELVRGRATHADVLQGVVQWLQAMGYEVETAEDARFEETLQPRR
ncbi:MAG: 3-hydroxyacyl-CoA dehydrogenase NAD-binding domain-containing protein [Janthinobacterium lividum]